MTIGYATEGTTDQRFLESIIKRTFDDIALQCENDIEVYDPLYLKQQIKGPFVDNLINLSRKAHENGLHVLCIHIDADNVDEDQVIKNKIKPYLKSLNDLEGGICKNIVTIIPVYMSEAWMLADKELLKQEIGTEISDVDLKINKHPEKFSDPKETIINALRIAQENIPVRRRKQVISDLYLPIGQQVAIEHLSALPSYQRFRQSVINSFKTLNYLY